MEMERRWPILLAALLSTLLLLYFCFDDHPSNVLTISVYRDRKSGPATNDGQWFLRWLHHKLVPAPTHPVHGHARANKSFLPLGPNITVCRPSFSDGGKAVNCCPGVPTLTDQDVLDQAIDFQFPVFDDSTVRVRRPAHHVTDEDYIAKYINATAYLKSLPDEHPHSFRRQANMHCLYCTGSFRQVHYPDDILRIHRSWLFFPWHRAYLYFHERILAKVMGDHTFALPYWNWDVPEGMVTPDMYMRGSLFHRVREVTHFPPHVTINDFHGPNNYTDQEQIHLNLALMYQQMVSGANTPELFMGCPLKSGPDGYCMGLGTVESKPHNSLHTWVGVMTNPEREDMGAFYAAARDPLFYAHHANIDRIWTVWREMHGNKIEFDDPDWFNSYFFFYDENLRLVRVKVSDMLDHTKLGYRYVTSNRPWLNFKPKPMVNPKIAKKALKEKEMRSDALRMVGVGDIYSPEFGPQGRLVDEVFTVKVPRKPNQRKNAKELEEEEVLVLYGIDIKEDVEVNLEVFVNVIDEKAALSADVRAREFAGTLYTLRSGKVRKEGEEASLKKKTMNHKIGISELLKDLEAEEDNVIWVTVVPRAKFTATIERIGIEYMGW